MVLHYIWIVFFLVGFIVGLAKLIFLGDTQIFPEMMNSTFENAELGFELALGLTGVMSLWLGLMKIGEKAGIITLLSRGINPLFRKLFPEIPKDHPATGSIVMNIAANMLGLDNAATPLGLRAMGQLQELNPKKKQASNAMIMFLVLNTSGLTIIPVSIMVYRAELGAANPSDIFLPLLLSTFFSTIVGLIAVAVYQRINLFNKTVISFLGGITLIIAGIIYYFSTLPESKVHEISSLIANIILFVIIISFISLAFYKK